METGMEDSYKFKSLFLIQLKVSIPRKYGELFLLACLLGIKSNVH